MVGQLIWWDDGQGNEGLLFTDGGDPNIAGDGPIEGLTDDPTCCCFEEGGCTCEDMTATLDIRFHAFSTDVFLPGHPCCSNYDFAGALIEQAAPFTIPGTQPDCASEISRYWKGTALNVACTSGDGNLDVEIACCPDEQPGGQLRNVVIRIGGAGGTWRTPDVPSCDCYWKYSNTVEILEKAGQDCAGCGVPITPSVFDVMVKCTSVAWPGSYSDCP